MESQDKYRFFHGLALLVFVANVVASTWFNLRSPYWLDELIVGSVACLPDYPDVLMAVRGDPSPPTHWLWVHVLFRLFGCDLMVARLTNAFFVTVALAYVLLSMMRRFNHYAGILFLLMFCCSVPVLYYVFEARMYGLMLFASLCMLAAILNGRWSLALLCALLSSLLHLLGWYLYLILVVLYVQFHGGMSKRKWISLLICMTLTLLVDIYSLAPMLSGLARKPSWFLPPNLMDLITMPSHLFGGMLQMTIYMVLGLSMAFFWGHRDTALLRLMSVCLAMVLVFILMIYAVSQIKPMFVARYFMFLTPILFLGISAWIGKGFSCEYLRPQADALISVLIILCGFLSLNDTLTIGPHFRPLGWDAMAKASICAGEDCGFVLDDPILPLTPDAAYHRLANYPVHALNPKVGWEAVRPMELDQWLDEHPGKKFVYVESDRPTLKIASLATARGLDCVRDKRQLSAYLCMPGPASR